MRKSILFLILSLLCGSLTGSLTHSASAQEKKFLTHEFSVSISGISPFDISFGECCFRPNEIGDYYRTSLGDVKTTGNISAEYTHMFKKWFGLSSIVGFNVNWANAYNLGDQTDVENRNPNNYQKQTFASFYVGVLPRFTWVNRSVVRCYSSIGLVAGMFNELGEPTYYVFPHLVPIGVSLGRKVFVYGEFGFGAEYLGGKFGLGYRF